MDIGNIDWYVSEQQHNNERRGSDTDHVFFLKAIKAANVSAPLTLNKTGAQRALFKQLYPFHSNGIFHLQIQIGQKSNLRFLQLWWLFFASPPSCLILRSRNKISNSRNMHFPYAMIARGDPICMKLYARQNFTYTITLISAGRNFVLRVSKVGKFMRE